MKKIIILCPFENKDKALLELEHHYLKQLKLFKVEIKECKSFGENQIKESQYLTKALKEYDSKMVYLFREKGKSLDTINFSKFIQSKTQAINQLVLVFSGAVGFTQEILKSYPNHLSLSDLTLPHKLSRLVLVEQIYRSHSIITQHPYHN